MFRIGENLKIDIKQFRSPHSQ